jgi:hypothetical protein
MTALTVAMEVLRYGFSHKDDARRESHDTGERVGSNTNHRRSPKAQSDRYATGHAAGLEAEAIGRRDEYI